MSRLWAVGVAIVVLLLCEAFAPIEAASGSSCEVRNVTRGTTGHALKAMVRAAHEGDHLWVRGRCVGDVVIGKDLTITGKGQAVVSGLDRYRVLLIREGARVVLRNLTITQGDGTQSLFRNTTKAWPAGEMRNLLAVAGFAHGDVETCWPANTDDLILWTAGS